MALSFKIQDRKVRMLRSRSTSSPIRGDSNSSMLVGCLTACNRFVRRIFGHMRLECVFGDLGEHLIQPNFGNRRSSGGKNSVLVNSRVEQNTVTSERVGEAIYFSLGYRQPLMVAQ